MDGPLPSATMLQFTSLVLPSIQLYPQTVGVVVSSIEMVVWASSALHALLLCARFRSLCSLESLHM